MVLSLLGHRKKGVRKLLAVHGSAVLGSDGERQSPLDSRGGAAQPRVPGQGQHILEKKQLQKSSFMSRA